MWIEPGTTFAGFIYAPDSLVMLRARDCAANASCSGTLNLQYIVGNEVLVELSSDRLVLGSGGTQINKEDKVTINSWTSGTK